MVVRRAVLVRSALRIQQHVRILSEAGVGADSHWARPRDRSCTCAAARRRARQAEPNCTLCYSTSSSAKCLSFEMLVRRKVTTFGCHDSEPW